METWKARLFFAAKSGALLTKMAFLREPSKSDGYKFHMWMLFCFFVPWETADSFGGLLKRHWKAHWKKKTCSVVLLYNFVDTVFGCFQK